MAKVYLAFAEDNGIKGNADPFEAGAPDIVLGHASASSFVHRVGAALNKLRKDEAVFCLVRQLSDSADEMGAAPLEGEVALLFARDALFSNGNLRLSKGDVLWLPCASQIPTFQGKWSAFVFCDRRGKKRPATPEFVQETLFVQETFKAFETPPLLPLMKETSLPPLVLSPLEPSSVPVDAFYNCNDSAKRLKMIKALSRIDLVLCVRRKPLANPMTVDERIYAVLYGKRLNCGK